MMYPTVVTYTTIYIISLQDATERMAEMYRPPPRKSSSSVAGSDTSPPPQKFEIALESSSSVDKSGTASLAGDMKSSVSVAGVTFQESQAVQKICARAFRE